MNQKTQFSSKTILEAAILCANEPVSMSTLKALLKEETPPAAILQLLREIQSDWIDKGLELVEVVTGWRFQSRHGMRDYIEILQPEKTPRYSRAVIETLAIIAYRQPVTRGDIEDVRGVAVNPLILKQLEDRSWIEVIGNRQTAGRPELFATTRQFLEDLGVISLEQLPPLDLQATNEIELAVEASTHENQLSFIDRADLIRVTENIEIQARAQA